MSSFDSFRRCPSCRGLLGSFQEEGKFYCVSVSCGLTWKVDEWGQLERLDEEKD